MSSSWDFSGGETVAFLLCEGHPESGQGFWGQSDLRRGTGGASGGQKALVGISWAERLASARYYPHYMAKSSKIPPVLTGVAGECFVAAELSRRGYIALISLRNTRGIDILATNQGGSRSITIQCKTNQKADRKWLLNEKSEEFVSKDHFYVFVALGQPTDRPPVPCSS
jgi:hypothetical protein